MWSGKSGPWIFAATHLYHRNTYWIRWLHCDHLTTNHVFGDNHSEADSSTLKLHPPVLPAVAQSSDTTKIETPFPLCKRLQFCSPSSRHPTITANLQGSRFVFILVSCIIAYVRTGYGLTLRSCICALLTSQFRVSVEGIEGPADRRRTVFTTYCLHVYTWRHMYFKRSFRGGTVQW